MVTIDEELNKLNGLPLPERLRKLAEWAEKNLSLEDQEWIYQQWQRVLMSYMEEPLDESVPNWLRGGNDETSLC